jgi:superfamily II helicase
VTSPELLVAIWQIIASRSKTLPPLETIRDNVILNAVLSEMERRGYVVKDGEQYKLTDKGRAIAADVWIPLEVGRLKSFKYVTPAFYVVLNVSNGLV